MKAESLVDRKILLFIVDLVYKPKTVHDRSRVHDINIPIVQSRRRDGHRLAWERAAKSFCLST